MSGTALVVALAVYCLCWLAAAFFAGAETGMISLNRARVQHRAEHGDRRARIISYWMQKQEMFLSTTLIGTNLAIVTATAVLTKTCMVFGPNRGPLLATVISTMTILIGGEILPKSIFRKYANRLMLRYARTFQWATRILTPVNWVVMLITKIIFRLLNIKARPRHYFYSKEELRLLLEAGEEEGVFTDDEQEMIAQVFDMGRTKTREIMIPLIDVDMIEEGASVSTLIDLARETGYSRYPVYRDRIDHVIGIVNIYDLLFASRLPQSLTEVIRPAYFVPEMKAADDLLQELQSRRAPSAVVVDEFGGAVGLITLEDIIEEIVGEIDDESDEPTMWYRQLGERVWVMDGKADLDEINEELRLAFLTEAGYDTLSGLILAELGHIPREGEKVVAGGCCMTVLRMEAQSIELVKLERQSDQEKDA